jgi:hypothetical protein
MAAPTESLRTRVIPARAATAAGDVREEIF